MNIIWLNWPQTKCLPNLPNKRSHFYFFSWYIHKEILCGLRSLCSLSYTLHSLVMMKHYSWPLLPLFSILFSLWGHRPCRVYRTLSAFLAAAAARPPRRWCLRCIAGSQRTRSHPGPVQPANTWGNSQSKDPLTINFMKYIVSKLPMQYLSHTKNILHHLSLSNKIFFSMCSAKVYCLEQ